MKTSLALLALASTASAGLLTAEYVEANHHSMWATFKTTHNKNYTVTEEPARKAIFKANMLKAAESQARNPKATFGATAFSAHTEEEFYPYMHGMVQVPTQGKAAPLFSEAELKQYSGSVDWRSKGAVTAVKDQGQCGSCWTFSTTGVTEGANFLHGDGKLTSLSEQQFVSCEKDMYGCNGGLPAYAYEYAMSEWGGKVVTEASYPYTSGQGAVAQCKGVEGKPTGATIAGTANIAQDENQMAAWLVKNGPISIGVNAATDWQSYTGGVLTNCAAVQPDHAVLIVGIQDGAWIVKNSWTAHWGEAGYIRLEFGSNQCNIVANPTAPTM
eukprot:TRINITY_DN164_c0_g2_i2.p2 TRINITY_DN164_c0_g2~~TRINITY_DN164_c0_g2_i2.p2  ORF type:complete len:328 (+),score=162.65 TRINITY_DN164_c0_g2_i2:65-1048(+)